MGSPLMSQFNWLLLFVYVNVAALALIFGLLPTHFAYWRRWYAARSAGVSTFMQPGWVAFSLLAMIAVLSWGVTGFLTAKLYYVDVEYATEAAEVVAGFPFAIQYNTETVWSTGKMGIYFSTTNSQWFTIAQSMFLGSLFFYVVFMYLFFAYHRTALALVAVTIAAAAAIVGAVFVWLLSWIPGIVSVWFPLFLIYAWVVNIRYVHFKNTLAGQTDDEQEKKARWVNDEFGSSIKSSASNAAQINAAKAAALQQVAVVSSSAPAPQVGSGLANAYAPAMASGLHQRTSASNAASFAAATQPAASTGVSMPLTNFY